jgi:hypothetical protein
LVCRGATVLPGCGTTKRFLGIFWIEQAHAFIKHLLKLYFEISR